MDKLIDLLAEHWMVFAAEYADSVGVDLITTSLSYHSYDETALSHTREELDGKSAFISRAAAKAASKGILVVASAGNDKQRPWQTIGFPGDVPTLLTVGGVTAETLPSDFSSLGFVTSERVKPDVAGMATQTAIIGSDGALAEQNGTSFSTPVGRFQAPLARLGF